MQHQKLTFQNAAAEQLSAVLDLPLGAEPAAYALFAHCFTCDKTGKAAVNISRGLVGQGIAVLRFDFTGLGESEGDFAETNFSSNVADLVAAARFLESEFHGPRILIGHSLGGAAVLRAAVQIPSAAAVVTLAAPADPALLSALLAGAEEAIEERGEAEVRLGGRTFRIRQQLIDDLQDTGVEAAIRNLDRALLVCHSPRDRVVDIENATRIFQTARHPKSFVSLDRADHLLSDASDSLYVGALVAAWARNYIAAPADASPSHTEDERVTVRTGKTRYRTEITARDHRMLADEPLDLEGTNTGPTPYEYLLSALGSCTSITLRMYADRKDWPLDAIAVRLSHEKVDARDCSECESSEGKVDVIEREIELLGPLTEDQRGRLLEIANKCPVHRTLHSEIVVRTRLGV